MKPVLYVIICFFCLNFIGSNTVGAEENVSIPWNEFKQLYHARIEKEVMGKLPKKELEQIVCIEESRYTIDIGEQHAKGEVVISGKLLQGKAVPISLFESDIIIDTIKTVTGGALLDGENELPAILFRPDGANVFNIALTFFVPVQEDAVSRYIKFETPQSIKKVLAVRFLSPELQMVKTSGIQDETGLYHIPTHSPVELRYSKKDKSNEMPIIEIDMLSRIEMQGRKTTLHSYFLPKNFRADHFILNVSDSFQFKMTSLKNSQIERTNKNGLRISLAARDLDGAKPFEVVFYRDEKDIKERVTFHLPHILTNRGAEGNFIIDESDNSQISIYGDELVAGIPIANLDRRFIPVMGGKGLFMCMPVKKEVQFVLKQFKPLFSPTIVLDKLSFFSSYEENGSVLSVLTMQIPKDAGSRLTIDSVPESQVWSLKVNGEKKKVYEDPDGSWIIPLASGNTSVIELAYLRKADKLGLYGKLDILLPRTGLAARHVYVGIALPHRVRLLSLEGPVNPFEDPKIDIPNDFIGRPYFFSRAFYKGDGMQLSLTYQEPAEKS